MKNLFLQRFFSVGKICFLIVCGLLILARNSSAQVTVPGYTPAKNSAATEQRRPNKTPYSKRYPQVKIAEAPVHQLPALESSALKSRDQRKQYRVGVVRKFSEPLVGGSENSYSLPDGKLFVSRIISTGAVALRVHFSQMSLPEGAQILVYALRNSNEVFGPYSGRGTNDSGDFWTPPITGESAVIEYFMPTSKINNTAPPYLISEVSHLYRQLNGSAYQSESDAATCNLEIPAEWKDAAKSVAAINYLTARFEYACSATLLNTSGNTGVPYLLTANHCISGDTEAAALQVTWFKDSASPTGQQYNNGADVIATGFNGDFTLLKLKQPAPAGVKFSGWTTERPAIATPVTGIHHPQNSYKRISFGKSITGTCPAELPAEVCDSFQYVQWNSGITEPGSSGSGLFVGAASDPKLVGTLTGGASSCQNPSGADVYGRLESYFPTIEYHLTGKGCAYKPDSLEKFIGYSGGEGAVSLNAVGSGACAWTASSLSSWIQITAGASGSGSQTITFTAEPNPGTDLRIGYLKVAGLLIAVSQAGTGNNCGKIPEAIQTGERVYYSRELTANDCSSMILPGTPADRFTINGKAGQQIAMEVFSDDFEPFLSIFSPDGKLLAYNQYGRIGYNLNNGFLTLPVDGKYLIEVTTSDAEIIGKYNLWFYKGCNCTLTGGQKIFDEKGGQSEFNVDLPPDCAWQVEYKPDWITINSASSGTGATKMNFTVAAGNTVNIQRTGYIRLFFPSTSSQNRAQFGDIVQNFPCEYKLTSPFLDIGITGSNGDTLYLDKGQYCPLPEIKSDSDWLKIPTPAIDYGIYVRFKLNYANLTPSSRTGHVIAGNAAFAMMQPGIGADCKIVPINVNSTISTSLDPACPIPTNISPAYYAKYRGRYYSFNGSAGQNITVNLSANDMNTTIDLIAPDGQVVTPNLGGQPLTIRLPRDGSYTLPRTGQYVIALGGLQENLNLTKFTLSLNETAGNACDWALNTTEIQVAGAGGQAKIDVLKKAGTGCSWKAESLESWATLASNAGGDSDSRITLNVAPNNGSTRFGFISIAGQHVRIVQEQKVPLGIVSGASYTPQYSSGSIASIFGVNLATGTAPAPSLPLPYSLAGTSVKLLRNYSYYPNTLIAQLFYVSPGQINFLIPEYVLSPGEEVTVQVENSNGELAIGKIKMDAVAPALFTQSSDGSGVAAALIQRVKGDVQTYEPVAELIDGKWVPKAIDFGSDGEQIYLVLFGTGIRYRTSTENVKAKIGDTTLPVDYAGPQNFFVGVDQVNILLPSILRGKGLVTVGVTVDGKSTNNVDLKIAP